ncbi:uncharacterized protein GIQ15_04877 [Arthroderma uncinatum]|uniref:uncharacterized protein n=1 Tax=Arthroderma uncinatum TaxID=74035 RepID=UPI00144ACAB0|nr:uncharacterized protein GIQ15_04877 [Arthroderma uncinatum]KAF3482118.1 hypothetical protein GIQ15_04877 [Arthroderma uncinatum]
MGSSWVPRILRPDFTWPRPMRHTISKTTPPVPHILGKTIRRAWGILHKALYHFSEWYCYWFDIPFDVNIVQLPFGLVVKWTDRTSIEEVAAMQMAEAAGMPVPKFLCCGETPDAPFNRVFSIMMTRLPGVTLENSRDPLQAESEGPWLEELKTFGNWDFDTQPASSGSCHGPFADEEELYEHLFSPASAHGFASNEEYKETLLCAKKIQQGSHRVTFTHGDFKAHNILVDDDGHLSGFLDWESAGWYPE